MMKSMVVVSFVLLISCKCPAQWVGDGTVVCDALNSQYDPNIVIGTNSGAIITWTDDRNSNLDIYFNIIDSTGLLTWSTNGTGICLDLAYQQFAGQNKIVSDGNGGAIIVWMDSRNYTLDIYAQRVDRDGNLRWENNGIPVCSTHAWEQNYPVITTDGRGGAIIAWADSRNMDVYDIYAQRVDSNGNFRWAFNGIPVCAAPRGQFNVSIANDESGGTVLGWTDDRYDSYDIYCQSLDSLGMPRWTTDGVAVCTVAQYQNLSKVISDGSGGALIAWSDYRNANFSEYGIYAQRIDSAGNAMWGNNGVEVISSLGDKYFIQILPDGSDGGLIIWEDCYGDSRIRAQRIDGSGQKQWGTEGIIICDTSYYQTCPRAVSDGNGGAIIAWVDFRTADFDLYVQHIDCNGNLLWQPEGVEICSYTGNQQYPGLDHDGSGGAIITWVDNRYGNADIYAQRILANGTVAGVFNVPPRPNERVSLLQTTPNPFSQFSTIKYSLDKRAKVEISIFNSLGQKIRIISCGEKDAGRHQITWDGRDGSGRRLGAGVYFCRMECGEFSTTVRMTMVR